MQSKRGGFALSQTQIGVTAAAVGTVRYSGRVRGPEKKSPGSPGLVYGYSMLPEANHRHRHRSAWTWRVSPSAIRHCSARARPRERKAPPAAPSGASWFSCGKRNRHMTTGRAMIAPGMAAVTSAVRHPRHGGRGRGPSSNRMACASAPRARQKKAPLAQRISGAVCDPSNEAAQHEARRSCFIAKARHCHCGYQAPRDRAARARQKKSPAGRGSNPAGLVPV